MKIHPTGPSLSYTKNAGKEISVSRIEIMKKIVKRFMIVSDTDLTIINIVKGYKNLWKIE
ncbi:MAG: hypothetical protein QXU18_14700 [Thermoplasmatales archaeon]